MPPSPTTPKSGKKSDYPKKLESHPKCHHEKASSFQSSICKAATFSKLYSSESDFQRIAYSELGKGCSLVCLTLERTSFFMGAILTTFEFFLGLSDFFPLFGVDGVGGILDDFGVFWDCRTFSPILE